MTKKMKFIWIDDSPDRESYSDNLGEALNVEATFKDVHKEDLEKKIKELLEEPEPDLIILDHNLHDIKEGQFKTGSTAATVIRETWVDCPIICVSGADNEYFSLQQKDIYEAIFPISDIARHYDTIWSIGDSYRLFKEQKVDSVDDLMHLFGEMDSEMDRLKSILPNNIKNNPNTPGVLKFISVWVRNILIGRPGFLYDRLWTATFIGIQESSFSKVEKLFEPARYTGLFNDPSNPRWWKHKILSILGETVEQLGLPWEKGIYLPGLTENDRSICYVTKAPFPETVAYLDDNHETRQPMKIKETVPDDSFEDLLYFEDLRKMAPAQ